LTFNIEAITLLAPSLGIELQANALRFLEDEHSLTDSGFILLLRE